jgi:hypothetical protein
MDNGSCAPLCVLAMLDQLDRGHWVGEGGGCLGLESTALDTFKHQEPSLTVLSNEN